MDRGRPRFRQGSTCPAVLRYCISKTGAFRIRGYHPLWLNFPDHSPTLSFSQNLPGHPHAALQPRKNRFGLLRVRSPLLAESQLMSVPELLRWFTSLSIAPAAYFIQRPGDRITPAGLPHSEICGSKDMCSSPQLITSFIVSQLHRHPPLTYNRLTILSFPLD